MRRRATAVVVALVTSLFLSSCVGPAPTTHSYRDKSVLAAQAALSELETALLSVETALRGRLPAAYLKTVLSQSEEAFSSVQSTFDSIQPPDSKTADQLRDALDQLLSDGAEGIAQLRILARRSHSTQLAAEAAKLEPTARELNTFAQDHQ